jgi:hypothetical protein
MTTFLDLMNDTITVLFLAPGGSNRREAVERLARLDCRVHEDIPTPAATAVPSDLLVLDLRHEHEDCAEFTKALLDDPRPLVVLAEGPCTQVRALVDRAAGTMLMTGAEDDSGYRVALSVSRGLAARRRTPRRQSRPRASVTHSPTLGAAPPAALSA